MDTFVPIEIDRLSVRFKDESVFENVSLKIPPKQFITLMGENGSGKTVLIETLMGYHKPACGHVLFWGLQYQDPYRARLNHRIGWVTSQREDYPTGLSCDAFFSLLKSCYPQWDESFVTMLVQRFQLDGSKTLTSLSLGEQSKIKLIKALAFKPDLLVLDELTANLSPDSKQVILQELLDQFSLRTMSVLYVSHSNEEAIIN